MEKENLLRQVPQLAISIRPQSWPYVLGFIFCTFVSQLPIWIVTYPPLSDYPNHLARMYILMREENLDILASFYRIQWSVLPNLAMDILVPPIGSLLEIELAGKIFVATTLFLISSGTFLLHRVLHCSWSIWPFFSFFFLYNALFLYGVLNFLFSLGVSLWALAFWVWSDKKNYNVAKFSIFRIIILFLSTLFIFICHLSAYAFFSLSVIAYQFKFNFSSRRFTYNKILVSITLLTLSVPLILFFFISPTSNISSISELDTSLGSYFSAMALRKVLAPSSLIINYHSWIDLFTLLMLGAVMISGFFSGVLSVNRLSIPALVLLAIGFTLTPFSVFGSHMADTRIFLALSFLVIVSINLELERFSKLIRCVAAFLVCVFVVRIGIVANKWLDEDSLAKNVLEAADKVPKGTRHFVSFSKEENYGSYSNSFKRQLPCLAIISRSAFVPTFYSMQGAQPVLLHNDFNIIKARSPGLLTPRDQRINWNQILEDFNFVWIGADEEFDDFPIDRLSLIEANDNFFIYKVLK